MTALSCLCVGILLSFPPALFAEGAQRVSSLDLFGQLLAGGGLTGVEPLHAVDPEAGRVELGGSNESGFEEPSVDPEGRYELQPGWWRVQLQRTNAHFDLYAPTDFRHEDLTPAVVFLHGSGATTSVYHRFLSEAADEAGVLLALPKSQSSRGWGFPGDSQSLFDTVNDLLDKAGVDPRRIAIAGHSAGGAYAYQNAYLSSFPYSAVFTLSAPFTPIVGLRDPEGYIPPIRMYYGSEDYNVTSGDAAQLVNQWEALGVEHELDIQIGYGHNTWPESTMFDGFNFLVVQANGPTSQFPTCQESDTTLCLLDGRFEVTAQWSAGANVGGMAHALLDLRTAQSGLFWFGSEKNWEILVKVVDGCALNDRYWVFAAATTNLAYELSIRDVEADEVAIYRNLLGDPAPAVVDTSAFATCAPDIVDEATSGPIRALQLSQP